MHLTNNLLSLFISTQIRGVTFFLGGFFMMITAVDLRLRKLTYRNNIRKAICKLEDKHEKDDNSLD